ncbi:hypothetical protein [Paraburkholderia fungorum]
MIYEGHTGGANGEHSVVAIRRALDVFAQDTFGKSVLERAVR